MRPITLSLLACFALVFTASAAPPGYICGPSGCFRVDSQPVQWQSAQWQPVQVRTIPVTPARQPSADEPAKYEWGKSQWDDNVYWLWRGPVIVGQWRVSDQTYRLWDGKNVANTATKPPIDPPGRGAEGLGKIQAWQMTGVDASKIEGKQEVFNLAGKYNLSPEELHGAFEGKLQDDSNKGYFIVIAHDHGKREEILREWNSLPQDFTRRYNVWAAAPDHFSMQDRFNGKARFATSGDPTIILQAPGGEVLARHPLSAEQIVDANSVKALLKCDPSYRPERDPGLPGTTTFDLSQVPIYVWLAIAVGFFLLMRKGE